LLNEPILTQLGDKPPFGRYGTAGNGHTVAMEAVFNNNEPVIDTQLALNMSTASGPQQIRVDFTTPARTGWTPRGFALRENYPWAPKIPPPGQDFASAASEATKFTDEREQDWLRTHESDGPAINLADELCTYVLQGGAPVPSVAPEIDVNGRYGPLGQTLLILVPVRLAKALRLARAPISTEQQGRYGEVTRMLLALGADPWIEEIAPMQVAAGFRDAVFGYHEGLRHMVESIAKGDARQNFIDQQGVMNGYTRLNDAAYFGRSAVVEILLDLGADKRIAGFNARTPYDAALIHNSSGKVPPIPDHILQRLRVP
jgi:hypothetical protein